MKYVYNIQFTSGSIVVSSLNSCSIVGMGISYVVCHRRLPLSLSIVVLFSFCERKGVKRERGNCVGTVNLKPKVKLIIY